MNQLIEVRHAGKTYRRGGVFGVRDDFTALKDIDLELKAGSCLGLLGRSGSGKSTLGRLVLGLERPDSGEVRFCGKALQSLKGEERNEYRRNVQVVFQNSLGSVSPRMRVSDIVAEPLRNFAYVPKDRIEERVSSLLEKVGLRADDGKKLPHQFSGGELQRVCIARAIVLDPKLIVLDEAVSSLDMLIQSKVLKLLRQLKEESNIAYLFISHDIRVLLHLSDRLAIIDEGRIVAKVEDMGEIDKEQHPVLKELLGSVLPARPM